MSAGGGWGRRRRGDLALGRVRMRWAREWTRVRACERGLCRAVKVVRLVRRLRAEAASGERMPCCSRAAWLLVVVREVLYNLESIGSEATRLLFFCRVVVLVAGGVLSAAVGLSELESVAAAVGSTMAQDKLRCWDGV